MDFQVFQDAGEYYQRVGSFLLQHEAENNLMISIITRLADGTAPWTKDPPWLYAVKEDGQTIACVVRTPPHLPILTDCTPAVTEFLASCLHDRNVSIPGFLGPKATVEHFVERWSAMTYQQHRLAMSLRIYRLDQVIPVSGVEGYAEWAADEDIDQPLFSAYVEEERTATPDVEEQLYRMISQRRLLLWKNPQPVSMAACVGPTLNGIRINMVYTPPEHRNHGYASANVAKLSQDMLDSGHRFCYLFTDLANPVSNSIYQRIGYRPVCDFADFRFISEEQHA